MFHPGDRDAARAELGIGDEAVMLYVGRIQPLKGLDLAIEATHRLGGRMDKDILFLVAGGASGPAGEDELDRLEKLVAARGLQHVVRFVGPQPHELLPTYYRAADVGVVCSHSESFGLTALEAHACGTPVVGTAVGGLSHIVANGLSGFLVESRDPELFADKLRSVLDTSAMVTMREVAARRAAAFSWNATAAALMDLYECLVYERLPEACTC